MHLPTDMPPGARQHLGPTNRAGLVTSGGLAQFFALYAKPWGPWSSPAPFPKVKPSDVAPNGVRPNWIVAINAYSPIAHRSTLTTTIPPARPSVAGVARPTQRPRPYAPGFVTRWPQIAPRWPSFSEAPGARRG